MIEGLIPEVAEWVERVLADMAAKGHPMKVTSTNRTWSQQNALYAQGRTKAGAIVTYARGGESYHNYQCAADLCFQGDDPWAAKNPGLWNIFGAIAKKYGFEWGGDWPGILDRPHIQMSFGLDIWSLKALGEKGAVAELTNRARAKYPKEPQVSAWAEDTFKKAEALGFSRKGPQSPMDAYRLRDVLVKAGFPIADDEESNPQPVTYEQLLHCLDKAGCLPLKK